MSKVHTVSIIATKPKLQSTEMGESWKDIIFLPFNYVIHWLFMIVTYISIIYNIYLITYTPDYFAPLVSMVLDIFCEVFYFIFMVLVILHRIVKSHRLRRYHKCHPIFMSVVDLISILPINCFYVTVNRYTWDAKFSEDQIKYDNCYLKLVRVLRLFYFYFDLRSNLTYNQKKIIIMAHFAFSMLFIISVGSIYFSLGVASSSKKEASWRDYYIYEKITFDPEYHFNWFILSGYEILCYYYNNVINIVHGDNINELSLLLLAITLGFISQFIFLLSNVISEDLQGIRLKYILQIRLECAKQLMTAIEMPIPLQKTVQIYYETIWIQRTGVENLPPIMEKLTMFMRNEIQTDIYWDAIFHAKIFNNTSRVFRRIVACQMKTEIYVPGHFIFQENDIKAKIVYIQSGMVEIYKMEKEDTRLTVTNGSILCEMSCLQPSPSNANVRCVQLCTVYVLYFTDFYKALRNYSKELIALKTDYRYRMKYARIKLRVVRHGKMEHIKFIKTQWRKIADKTIKSYDPHFTSLHLDLLTLTEIDVHPNAFCLRGSCPFVMKSNTRLYFTFHYLALIAAIVNFLLCHKRIIFEGEVIWSSYMYYAMIDTTLFVEIYIQLISTVETRKQIITMPYEIFVYKLKNLYFVLDLIATVPIDYFLIISGCSKYTIGLGRMNRFIRLYKIILFFGYYEKRVSAYSGIIKVTKYIVFHTFFCLLFSCVLYMVTCWNLVCDPASWITDLESNHLKYFGYEIPISVYFNFLYYTANIYLKLLLMPYTQRSLYGILARMFLIVCSAYILIWKIGQICATFGLRYENKHVYLENRDMVEVYLHENKELKKYKDKLLECLATEWAVSGDMSFRDLAQVSFQKSEVIQRNVSNEYLLMVLQKTKFFQKFSTEFLRQIALEINIFLVPKDHDIVKSGERCFYLNIIVQGHCMSYSHVPGDHENQTVIYHNRYDVFPIIEYVHEINSFLRVKTCTTVLLMTIPYSVFNHFVGVYTKQTRFFKRALRKHETHYWGLIKGMTISPFVTKARVVGSDKSKPNMFTYNIKRQNLILDITNCSRQNYSDTKFLKYRECLKYVSFNTYSPNSKKFLFYEGFRCTCIVVEITMIYLMCVPYIYNKVFFALSASCFCILWVVDMLVKAHLSYYNDYGIFVTGVRATVKHYFKNSFILDLFAGLPYTLLKFHMLASQDKINTVEVLMLLNTRHFLLLRPIKFLTYLQGDGLTKFDLFLKYLKLSLMLYCTFMYLAAMKLLLTCTIGPNRQFVCPDNSWIMLRKQYNNVEDVHLYWVSLKQVLSIGDMEPDLSTFYDHVLTLFTSILVYSIQLAVLCKVTGDHCMRQPKLVRHQNRLTIYNTFFANRLVSNHTKSQMLLHFKNIWQKSYSDKAQKSFENIYPYLRETLILTMYRKAVSKCVLFQNKNEILFKLFIPYLHERYYIKNADIIRPNDVQGNIFIIVKGEVEILVADTVLATIGTGAIFGCFEPLGLNRQTFTFKAKVHVNVLAIESTRFYRLSKGFKRVESCMARIRFTQFQYAVLPTKNKPHGISFISGDSARSLKLNDKLPKLFKIYEYITNVHLAPLSVYIVLMDCYLRLDVITMLPVWICFDLYFATCFLTRGRIATVDTTTGLDITHHLVKTYLRSWMAFFDVVTLLPFYLLRIWLYQDYHQSLFLTNKLLRIYYLYNYYAEFVKTKNVPCHLQRAMLIYGSLFLMQLIFITWWIINWDSTINHDTMYILKGYMNVMNFISISGIIDDNIFKRTNVVQLFMEILLLIITKAFVIIIVQMFTKHILSENTHSATYRYEAYFCHRFCVLASVSKSLLKRTWLYLNQLYLRQNGEQFPELYSYAPSYLKQDHMQSLYGRHFTEHKFFYDLHIDLIRQIQTHIKCALYLPGDIIVESGLNNGRIYFIEKGQVIAIQSDRTGENLFEILEDGRSFGDVQAILGKQHNRTYKALTEVELFFITLSEWKYLLHWFPASRDKLYNRVREYASALRK